MGAVGGVGCEWRPRATAAPHRQAPTSRNKSRGTAHENSPMPHTYTHTHKQPQASAPPPPVRQAAHLWASTACDMARESAWWPCRCQALSAGSARCLVLSTVTSAAGQVGRRRGRVRWRGKGVCSRDAERPRSWRAGRLRETGRRQAPQAGGGIGGRRRRFYKSAALSSPRFPPRTSPRMEAWSTHCRNRAFSQLTTRT